VTSLQKAAATLSGLSSVQPADPHFAALGAGLFVLAKAIESEFADLKKQLRTIERRVRKLES